MEFGALIDRRKISAISALVLVATLGIYAEAAPRTPIGAVVHFDLATCPVGYTPSPAGDGRYVVGLQSNGTIGSEVGEALDPGEDRPTGRHVHGLLSFHEHRNGGGCCPTIGSPPMFGDESGDPPFVGRSQPDVTSAKTNVSINLEGVPGTNAPYARLVACLREVSNAEVDLNPGSTEPMAINLVGRGVIPVTIVGTETFDVANIDREWLSFGPSAARPTHKKGGHFEDVNKDGLMDLVSHYRTQDAGFGFGDTSACTSGETSDGGAFKGCGRIRTVPACGIGFELALLLPPMMWLHRRRGLAGHMA